MVTFLRPSSLNSPLILSCFLSCPTPLAKLYSVLNVYRSSCFLPHGLISPETDDTLFEFPFPGKLFQESPNQPWSWKELKPGKIPPQRPQRGPSSQYKSKNMTVFSACQQLLPMPFYSQGSQQVIPLCQQFVPPPRKSCRKMNSDNSQDQNKTISNNREGLKLFAILQILKYHIQYIQIYSFWTLMEHVHETSINNAIHLSPLFPIWFLTIC